MILHNMIVHFEANRRDEFGGGTMDWAIEEAEGWEEDGGDRIGEEQGTTSGQQFWVLLMEKLLEQRGIRV